MKTGSNELLKIINSFHKYNVLVIGDIIIDEYIRGKASRLSPEAPVPVLEVKDYSYVLGGAANVAHNIASLGGNAHLAGVAGDDIHFNTLVNLLDKAKINHDFIVKTQLRPTTVKTRLIAHNHQQLARIDKEIKTNIDSTIENELIEKIKMDITNFDLIILSDYAKGVLTQGLIEEIISLAKQNNIIVLVDPKGLDFCKYVGADIITPNRLEAETATKSPSGACPLELAKALHKITQIKNVLVTLGEDGIFALNENGSFSVPAVTSEVYDVTGAGDTLISTIALAYPASGNNLELAILLGNYAAGVAVRKIGTTTVSPKQLVEIIEQNPIDTILTKVQA